ncbi:MAG: hypothetical protein AB1714_07505 [Acidobacteriota bacterium]
MLRKSVFIVGVFALFFAFSATAQTVDELIAKNTEARGGLDKVKAIQSVKISGRSMMGGGMEAPFVLQIKRPGLARLDVTIQGKTLVQAYDGEAGWQIIPFMGSTDPEKMPEEELKQWKEQSDLDGPLVDYKAKGHTVELMGKEDLEGSPAYKLKLTLKDGDMKYVYVDAENYLTLKETTKTKREGTEIEVDSYFGDFKPVEGVMFPHSIDNRVQGNSVGQMVVDKIEVGAAMDDGIFKMPPKAAPAEPAK